MSRAEDDLTVDADGRPLPPWRKFPYWPTSMGWRMGDGDWYLGAWQAWYLGADEETKRRYRRVYPAPLYWFDFYWNYGEGPIGCFMVALVQAVGLPVRIVGYCWHRIKRGGPRL